MRPGRQARTRSKVRKQKTMAISDRWQRSKSGLEYYQEESDLGKGGGVER